MTLNGFEDIPGNGAGSFIGAPPRLVLHTTEGSSADGAIGAYRTNNSWPHFTVDVQRRRKIQHLELDVAARALLHPPGTGETNRANAVQIELVGFATETPGWAKADLQWLATDVLAAIRAVVPFALVAAQFVAYPASAGTGSAQRFTWDQWAGFSGICGHEHVPGNDHGDPGLIDTTTILAALGSQPQPEDDMFTQDDSNRLRNVEDLLGGQEGVRNKVDNLARDVKDNVEGGPAEMKAVAAVQTALKQVFGVPADATLDQLRDAIVKAVGK